MARSTAAANMKSLDEFAPHLLNGIHTKYDCPAFKPACLYGGESSTRLNWHKYAECFPTGQPRGYWEKSYTVG